MTRILIFFASVLYPLPLPNSTGLSSLSDRFPVIFDFRVSTETLLWSSHSALVCEITVAMETGGFLALFLDSGEVARE